MPDISAREVLPRPLYDEVRDSYLDYAMSVIVGRALPDVADGLKPVQRRILVAMHDAHLDPSHPRVKSAKVAGDTHGNYHPHGDAAIYQTFVRMAQNFSYRYPLVDGQGNFGSVDGDPPAAARYTEVRMSPLAVEMLADIEKNTVEFRPTYDEQRQEPVVLPAKFPNLLCNGAEGIAVGMATKIPPHNLGEVADAVGMLVDKPQASVDDLMTVLPGPDFPTGGTMMGKAGIVEAYKTGRGSLTVQGRAVIEPLQGGRSAVIITELPYQVNKASLVEHVASLAREGRLKEISDIRDESDRSGMRIVIEVKRDGNPNVLLNQLHKSTALRTTFGVIMLVLVKGVPRVLNIKRILECYIAHRREVITRRTQYDLDRALERKHIVDGFLVALANIEQVVKIIRFPKDQPLAAIRTRLKEKFKLSDAQCDAILAMPLQRLAGLEEKKLAEEQEQLAKNIARFRKILAHPKEVDSILKKELLELKEKYGGERRTRLQPHEAEEISVEDLIAQEDMAVTVTRDGYIKRLPVDTYRVQSRGGKGVVALTKKEEDSIEHLFVTTTHHVLLFFTTRGKVYQLRAYEVPLASRQARGTAIINMVQVEADEKVTAVVSVKDFAREEYLLMVTQRGVVKKTALKQFDTPLKRKGIIAMQVASGDELHWVRRVSPGDQVVLATREGMAVRFKQDQVRPMGRAAAGVRGIRLRKGDQLVGAAVVRPSQQLLTASENGYGKRTQVEEYRLTARGTQGVANLKVTAKTGKVVGIAPVDKDDEVMVISAQGILIRQPVREISVMGRATQGVRLIRLGAGDKAKALAKVVLEAEGG